MNVVQPEIVQKIIIGLKRGDTLRKIADDCQCSKTTVSRYEEMYGPFRCQCGQPRKHRGWCFVRLFVRFTRSKRRQATLAAMHERQRAA